MIRAEKKLLEWIDRHVYVLFLAAVLLIGCYMRLLGYHFLSDDAELYLLKWYDAIAEKGISEQVGNYNIPYQILIYILTKLPMKPLHAYKTLSCAFDLVLSMLVGWVIWDGSKSRGKAVLAFTAVFCSPVVLMNSAVWAQCDAIYAFFGFAALYMLLREKYIPSFLLLGVSFAFKLQAVFLFPFFIIVYLCRKKFSILHFLLVPVAMTACSLPGAVAGRNLLDTIGIYAGQTKIYPRMYIKYANIYTLVTKAKGSGEYQMFRNFAILLTILVLGLGLYLCMTMRADFFDTKIFWGITVWTLYSCCFFLPNMHERYGYLAEISAILYSFITPEALIPAVILNLLSVMNYSHYLFDYQAVPLVCQTLLSLSAYLVYTFWLFGRLLGSKK